MHLDLPAQFRPEFGKAGRVLGSGRHLAPVFTQQHLAVNQSQRRFGQGLNLRECGQVMFRRQALLLARRCRKSTHNTAANCAGVNGPVFSRMR